MLVLVSSCRDIRLWKCWRSLCLFGTWKITTNDVETCSWLDSFSVQARKNQEILNQDALGRSELVIIQAASDTWVHAECLFPAANPPMGLLTPTGGQNCVPDDYSLCFQAIVCLRGHINQLILNERHWVVTDTSSGEICNQITKA